MKKASIKLVLKKSLVADPCYEVVQLVNCSYFSLDGYRPGSKVFRVEDELSEMEADIISTDKRFTVTIGKAK